ncbi:Serine-threonine/tyrosine-protein kinase, catalytic domain [Sesbania bispinosa]|nr:Serine-threonine/tyrosine-protein kinase, catalytic domain [Sesbania bispinosa]
MNRLSSEASNIDGWGKQFNGKIPAIHRESFIPHPWLGSTRNMQTQKLDMDSSGSEQTICLGRLQDLRILSLTFNSLGHNSMKDLEFLKSLTNCKTILEGMIPASFGKFQKMQVGSLTNIDGLDLSENHLSGNLPGTIGKCMSLEYLYLQGNSFNGSIPSSLASLKGLQELDLSRNRLSGSIPKGLQNISFLEYLNVSFNMLDGEVPTEGVFRNASALSVVGNNNLCGGISKLHLPPCPVKGMKPAKHHNFKLITVIVSVIAFLLILLFVLTIYWMRKRNKKPSSHSPIVDQLPKVSYQDLHNGSNGFSARNLVGYGNFGSVYKGTLESEHRGVVAIKVLNLQKKGAQKSFIAECDALKNIRHRNLVKILTCCSSTDYKAVHYLHSECGEPVIHCDLKPSNVLLDECMVAHVSDFGLARLLSSVGVSLKQSNTIGIKGTIGYAPPEYGMGSEVSIEGDMYSFGILVLEMLTGKRPTDEMFKNGLNLHSYVENSISNHLLQIVDSTLLPNGLEQATDNGMHPNVEKCLLSLFRIALSCSVESPRERMSMVDVTRELNLIKSFFPHGV